ncbi:MAG: aminotransferase class V-fold PLP-dependent enzyme [Fuerstiella sp.]
MPPWPIADDAVRDVFEAMLQDGSWGRYHGPHCDRLRDALARFHDVEHVILCSSGTVAVELALRSVKVQPDDEVVLAAYDYKANFANVLTLQATPVLVDTHPGVPVPDPEQLKKALSDKTTAIVCSHLHGCFADMDAIRAVAAERGVPVIEDACQATGGRLNGKVAGSIGDVGVLSFGGSKLLTAGRGGAVLTNDATLAQRIRLYTQRGNDAYPLSEMQSAVLLPQLQQLDERTHVRLQRVRQLLNALPKDSPLKPALLPHPAENIDDVPAFYKVAFRFESEKADGRSREDFATVARQNGVALDSAFTALHKTHSQRRFRAVGDLSNAAALHEELMILHHPVLLQGADEIDALVAAIGS